MFIENVIVYGIGIWGTGVLINKALIKVFFPKAAT